MLILQGKLTIYTFKIIENYMLILIQKLTIANHFCGIEIFLDSGYVESREDGFLKERKTK
jgi:hypothetical protein